MWKKFIEKSVTDSTLGAFQMFKELAERQLENCAESPPLAIEEGATSATLLPPGRAPGSRTDTPPAVLPNGPMHRRTPSRPSSPEEVLPATNEEWEKLLSQVEPQWRGGLRALRRTQVQAAGAGPVAVGLTAPRHRRRGSRARSIDWQGMNVIPGSPRTPLAKVPEGGIIAMGGGEGWVEESRSNVNSSNSSFWSRRWPTLLLCLLGVVIICLQAALVGLHIRAARSNANGLMLSAAFPSSDADGRAVREAMMRELSALTSQTEGLQAEVEGWRSRIASRAEEVKFHAKRMQDVLQQRKVKNSIYQRTP
jgi:hypothetical protein